MRKLVTIDAVQLKITFVKAPFINAKNPSYLIIFIPHSTALWYCLFPLPEDNIILHRIVFNGYDTNKENMLTNNNGKSFKFAARIVFLFTKFSSMEMGFKVVDRPIFTP